MQDNHPLRLLLSAAILALLLPLSAQGQYQGIGFDASTSASTGSGTASSLTFSHPVGASGSDRLLIVGVSIRNSGSQTVSSVTYNGVNLTQIGARSNSTNARVEIWQLVAPAIGANNVVVTMSAAARFVAGSASFTDVDQTTPVGTFFSNTGSSITPSVDVTGVLEGEAVIDTIANRNLATGSALPIAGTGQTERWNDRTTSGTADDNTPGSGSTEPAPAGGGTVNMAWTLESSRQWAIGAVALRPKNPANAITDIEIDSTSSGSTGTSFTSSLSWSHTVGTGSDRFLIVGVSISYAGTTVTSAKYGGTGSSCTGGASLTSVGARDAPSSDGRIEMWRLINPASGTNNICVTVSNSLSTIVGGGISFTGVHQTTPLGTFASAAGSTGNPSVVVSSATREVVVDVVMFNGTYTTLTVGAGQTQRWNTTASGIIGAGSTEPGASSVTMSWTVNGGFNDSWAIGGVSLKYVFTPTAVTVSSFTATRFDGKILLQWRTGYEIDNLGFHLYRDEGGQLTRITPSVVAGSALFAGAGTALTAGRSYRWWDSEASTAARYWLEDIDLGGKRTTYGPITPGIGGTPESENASAPLVSELGARSASLSMGSMAAEQRAGPPTGGGSNLLTQWAIAAGPAVKLGIRHEGWYRIGQPDLVAAGLDPMIPPNRLQLFVDGQEQPISVVGEQDGRFDPQDAVEFYGTGLETPSTDMRIYWLVSGTMSGRRIATGRGLSASQLAPRSFLFTVERKDRVLYFAALRNGEAENFFGPAITTEPVQQSLSLQHLDSAPPGLAKLDLALQGATQGTHRVGVWLNGVGITTVTFEGQALKQVGLLVSQAQLQEGANWVTLAAQNGEGDVSLLDFIRLSYWHTYTADGDALRFTAPGSQRITVDWFTSPAIRVLDITSPAAATWVEGTVQAQGSGYAVTFTAPQRGNRVFLAFTDAGVGAPPLVLANQPSNWNQSLSNVDMVLIAQQQFLDRLVPLKALREAQGWSVALVDVEDAYDEFSFGAKSPWALRDLLTLASASSHPPRYLLLVGDATMDPRNYLGMGDFDLVPTKLVDTALLETASDDWFGDFNGDGIPEMAVGRLAVRSAQQAATAVAKIVGYEQAGGGSWTNEALVVADRNDTFDFESAAFEIETLLPSTLRVQEIFLGQSDIGTARTELLAALNHGVLMVQYFGHGSESTWSSQGLLTAADVQALTNGLNLPVVIAMNCLNGLFQDVYSESLAEALLNAEQGGAVAVWASSGATDPNQQIMMARALAPLLFETPTLGEAILRAKMAVPDQDVRRTWILFGDPATRLR